MAPIVIIETDYGGKSEYVPWDQISSLDLIGMVLGGNPDAIAEFTRRAQADEPVD
jgi:hypothetical protein